MAVVIMVVIASSCAQPGLAAPCEGKTVLALIDTTTAYDDVDRAGIKPAIERMAVSLKPGQRLLVRTVRDATDTSRLLFDGCVPPGWEMSWSPVSLLESRRGRPGWRRFSKVVTQGSHVRTGMEPRL